MHSPRPRSSVAPPTHLYVHIPFCPSKCPYCAFVTHIGSLTLLEPYLDALHAEAARLARLRPGGALKTIYLGGGTPSLLSPAQLTSLLKYFEAIFGFDRGCEITIEAHPATVDRDKLRGFRAAGATRISFGGESLQPRELEHLGRTHGGERVVEVVAEARASGFESVNVDFMYGVPEQTVQSWGETLSKILRSEPDHLSLYPLSIEPRTVFSRLRDRNQLEIPDDDTVVEMYHLARDGLREAGFIHYEIANWARPGKESSHNLAYWRNREFYAVGAGAHGYLHPYRTENIPRTRRYIETVLDGGSACAERITIDSSLEFNETVMLRLRLLTEGLDLIEIGERFGIDLGERFSDDIRLLTGAGLMRAEGGRLFLEETAVPVANEIWARFTL